MNIDMVRKDFEKWLLTQATKEEAAILAEDPELLPFVAGYLAALEAIDPDAIRRECADRAFDYIHSTLAKGLGYDDYNLRAAILGTEPAREES